MSVDQAIRVRLVNRRVALGLTQRQLADRMGVVQSRISHLEMGLNEPGVTTLGRWAEALGMRARVVLDDPFDGGKAADRG